MGPMKPSPSAGSKDPKHKIALHIIMIGMPKKLGKPSSGKRSTK